MTKEEAYKNHVILWQGIVDYLKENKEDDGEIEGIIVKLEVFHRLFPGMKILHSCFLCEIYFIEGNCLDTCPLFSGTYCSDRCKLYSNFLSSLDDYGNSIEDAIKLAEEIRDIVKQKE